MSRALAIVTAILTILHSYVSAQAPTCLPGYTALFNSLGQSPCTMTVALGGVCVDGAFTLSPLQPGFVYLGPTQISANSCRCSTVYYSLLSACAYCQNQTYLDWSIYDVNCTIVYNQVFSDPIPSSILVPHYAYLDVVTSNSFNVTAAESAGGPESSSVPQATSSSIAIVVTSTSTPTSVAATKSKKSNIGAIVGGVVGGLAFLGIAVGLIAFVILRGRKRSAPTTSTYSAVAVTSPELMMSNGYHSTISTMPSGKIYDPNDPSTFPSDPAGYSTYSGSSQVHSPQRGITPTITGTTQVHAARTQYTGAPEL